MTIGSFLLMLLLVAGGVIGALLVGSVLLRCVFSIHKLSEWRDRQIAIIEEWQSEDE